MKHQPLCVALRCARLDNLARLYWFTLGACFGLGVANAMLSVLP